ncbi:hypothetical protein [Actinoplanes sp. NPDC051411]|uniref:hypothetical protein n=1 Tax=Actinoplanes sp. NPDC051411 TaxID=3155522 RepID=UPI003421B343
MIPVLQDVAGEWIAASELAHLPSLRNQIGQGHVNADLSSMSWIAAPPYTFGYHTGRLHIDGVVPMAQRFRWKPWGVQRSHTDDRLTILTDTRMSLGEDVLLWEITVTNRTDSALETLVSQDLFAPVAHSETGWGWLYDVPWNSGNYHDFMTLERVRSFAPHLVAPGKRTLRLGVPRLPGLQRDGSAMSLDDALPRHVSADTVYPHRTSVAGAIRSVTLDGSPVSAPEEVITLHPAGEVTLEAFELRPGAVLACEVRLDRDGQTGVLLTHGNHPDSLQVGVSEGSLWVGIGGEKAYGGAPAAGVWHHVAVHLSADRVLLVVDGVPAASTQPWTAAGRWTATYQAGHLTIVDSRSAGRAVYSFGTLPGSVELLGAGGQANWRLRLGAGEARTVSVACSFGASADRPVDFDRVFARGEEGWERLWQNAFTPGNPDFSGHLPTLSTPDTDLAKSYYMAALLAVYMRNTRVSPLGPVFLTGGPRLGPTTTFYWDHTEWSRLYALLEPAGLRSWLLAALASPYSSAFGFDTRHLGPLGNHYASNEYSLFRLVEHYVGVTSDLGFLDVPASDRTVLEHLRGFATRSSGALIDYGSDPWELLECVPNYVNVVAGFNAAQVGMMRSFAALEHFLGQPAASPSTASPSTADAAAADAAADALAAAVIGLAAPGGRWRIVHPGRSRDDVIGHCLDFGLVAAHLQDDLPPSVSAAMIDFVETRLLAATWMRALALDDPAAPLADRPDHGAAGAFGAWPGVTAYGLARLGRPDLALNLLRETHRSASGALWGQAQEIVGDRVRVAEAGVSNRDAVSGVATAEAIVAGLFGYEPGFRALAESRPEVIEVPGLGRLRF